MKKFLPLTLILALLLSGCTMEYVPPTQATTPVSSGDGTDLTVHFLDVGQADCILLECDGEFMLIDGGNREDGQFVVSYLEQQGVEYLNTVICTHAHEDHVGGLPSVLAVYPTHTILSPTTTYSSKIFDDFLYYADQQRVEVEIPEPGNVYHLVDNDSGATITVLGPVKSYAETNDTSIVCRVDFGETSFLFTGDMEVAAENDMLDYWEERRSADIVNVDVLKVGHHGSDTSTGYRFLYEADPTYGIISVGTGNTYGHPHSEPMSQLSDAGVTTFRTDEMGTILAVSDGREITFTWEDQSAQPGNAEESDSEAGFIGNKNSKKFHSPDCANLPKESNQVPFSTYEDAVNEGYSPCGSCLG